MSGYCAAPYLNLGTGTVAGWYVGSQKHFKKYSAFELRGRNQNSDKCIRSRIEFCLECIFAIFEYSVFEILIGILDIFFRSRARARQPVGVASGRATRPRPRALRGIPRMQALVLALPPAPAWRPPESLGALSVVIRTIWVKSNRLGGPGRRLKNILCGLR